jgi:hypothetical protein
MRPLPTPCRAVLATALLCLAAVPSLAQDTADPFEQAKADYIAADGFDARLAIVRDFLADHPDHERVPEVLRVGRDLYLDERDDRPAAVAMAEQQLAVSSDPEVRAGIRDVLLDLYGAPAYAYKLQKLLDEHYDAEAMSFVEHLDVLEAASNARAWELVDAHVAAAEPLASAETFRADYPDREFSDEEVDASARNREGLLLTFAGWSRANQDDRGKALRLYDEADEKLRKGYLGVPGNDLYRYWGETLLMEDETDAGLEKLTLAAIYANDDQAEAILREHWAKHRPGQDYEAFAWSVRQDHAPTMSDFTATDYQGTEHSFAQLKGDEATLLAFWFPT